MKTEAPALIARDGTWDQRIIDQVLIRNEYRLPADMKGWAVVDIGAHVGAFAVACKERGAEIRAYEADEDNFEVLLANTKGMGDIRCFRRIVLGEGDVDCGMRATGEHDFGLVNTGHRDVFGAGRRSSSIGEILELVAGLDLLKLDCEGSEWFILDALDFSKVKRIVAELHAPPQGDHPLLVDLEGETVETLAERVYHQLKKAGFDVEIAQTSAATALMWAEQRDVPHVFVKKQEPEVVLAPEVEVPCLCGAKSDKLWFEKQGTQIVTCRDCGVSRVKSYDAESYAAQYMSGFYQADYKNTVVEEEYTRRFAHDKKVAQSRLAEIAAQLPAVTDADMNPIPFKGKRMLDIGCANGAFVEAALWRRADAYGIDLSGASFAGDGLAENRLQVAPLHSSGFTRRSMDIVTLFDVIEHIPDPKKLLRQVCGLLRRDGLLVMDTPDFDGLRLSRDPANERHVKPTEHIWYLTSAQWQLLLKECGFVILDMAFPIEGKVVLYARPDPDVVMEVRVDGPTGIGDVHWILQKLPGLKKAEAPCTLSFGVPGFGEPHLLWRSAEFLRLLPWIDELRLESGEPVTVDAGAEDLATPHYRMIANQHLECGGRIEDYYPEFETSFDYEIHVGPEAERKAASIKKQVGKLVLLYASSKVWNHTVSPRNDWGPAHWNELISDLNKAGIRPLLIGKDWDRDYAPQLKGDFINMLGQTPMSLLCALFALTDAVIGMCAGVTILAPHLRTKSIVFWPKKAIADYVQWEKFALDWVEPSMISEGRYRPLFIGDFGVEQVKEQLREWGVL